MEREEPSSSRLVVAAAVLLLLIAPPVSPLSNEGPFPPPLPPVPPPRLNRAFHDRDSAIVAQGFLQQRGQRALGLDSPRRRRRSRRWQCQRHRRRGRPLLLERRALRQPHLSCHRLVWVPPLILSSLCCPVVGLRCSRAFPWVGIETEETCRTSTSVERSRPQDLSGNALYGDIPFFISKLKQLEEL
ncbi:hypothetical protein BHE74_00036756 [Ensete ventricosum]|nr:hypothetical protein BHE74_00036756 [Ensete ventricosum]RZS11907.1 hypothetical protein BHM03_00043281 [Ensete ventricosum]